jgi:hypothetical protein
MKIDTCAAFIVIMSPDAEQSSWVNREIGQAEANAKPIYPLLLGGDVFFRLNDLQFETVTDGRMPSEAFVRFLAIELVGGVDHTVDQRRSRSGRPRLTARQPFVFEGTPYTDPRELIRRMTYHWPAALRVVAESPGATATTLEAWLMGQVGDAQNCPRRRTAVPRRTLALPQRAAPPRGVSLISTLTSRSVRLTRTEASAGGRSASTIRSKEQLGAP